MFISKNKRMVPPQVKAFREVVKKSGVKIGRIYLNKRKDGSFAIKVFEVPTREDGKHDAGPNGRLWTALYAKANELGAIEAYHRVNGDKCKTVYSFVAVFKE